VTFRRDAATGDLTRVGCLVVRGAPGCPGGDVLFDGPREPTPVIADGRFAYVTSRLGIQVARIDPATSAVSLFGCFARDTPVCTRVPALRFDEDYGPRLVLGGRRLYATAIYRGPAVVRWLSLDPGTGALRAGGCLGGLGCGALSAPEEPDLAAASPDGRFVVVSDVAYDAIGLLARDRRTGALRAIPGPGRLHRRPQRRPAALLPEPVRGRPEVPRRELAGLEPRQPVPVCGGGSQHRRAARPLTGSTAPGPARTGWPARNGWSCRERGWSCG
jgi:hypothetical protein